MQIIFIVKTMKMIKKIISKFHFEVHHYSLVKITKII